MGRRRCSKGWICRVGRYEIDELLSQEESQLGNIIRTTEMKGERRRMVARFIDDGAHDKWCSRETKHRAMECIEGGSVCGWCQEITNDFYHAKSCARGWHEGGIETTTIARIMRLCNERDNNITIAYHGENLAQ